ncbi:uncharacterized protein LOC115627999 [Scaptodrosophila lebanonensis]|uniref:Uncharacterized protein LOC115627999 n=1 Tax=Drosophila lebanonensis TaxID=7225 RepID=A0A6J2TT56_DROLE|nr:uncharacterized protein LOC115627999 [Scaptodrosophila lebanonensis]
MANWLLLRPLKFLRPILDSEPFVGCESLANSIIVDDVSEAMGDLSLLKADMQAFGRQMEGEQEENECQKSSIVVKSPAQNCVRHLPKKGLSIGVNDLMFLVGVYPDMKAMTDLEKFEFRLGVCRILHQLQLEESSTEYFTSSVSVEASQSVDDSGIHLDNDSSSE